MTKYLTYHSSVDSLLVRITTLTARLTSAVDNILLQVDYHAYNCRRRLSSMPMFTHMLQQQITETVRAWIAVQASNMDHIKRRGYEEQTTDYYINNCANSRKTH